MEKKLFQKYFGSFKCGFGFLSDLLLRREKKGRKWLSIFRRRSVILEGRVMEESAISRCPHHPGLSGSLTSHWGFFFLLLNRVFPDSLGPGLQVLICKMEMYSPFICVLEICVLYCLKLHFKKIKMLIPRLYSRPIKSESNMQAGIKTIVPGGEFLKINKNPVI